MRRDTTLQIWVREWKPKSSREAGELANCNTQARGDKQNFKDEVAGVRRQSKVTCFKCGEEGHGVAQCRNGPEALWWADDKYSQPKDERQRRSKDSDMRCYNCNRAGHLARNCPARRT